jgi:hypothetical protein
MQGIPLGDQTLVIAEAELIRVSVAIIDRLHEETDGLANEWPSGVRLLDELSWQQRLVLLARVAGALLKPDAPMPNLSAVNEAAVAAIFAQIHCNLIIELDNATEPHLPVDYDIYYWRRRIAACQEPPQSEEEFFLHQGCVELREWEVLLDCLADQILWDADWDMPDLFLDAERALSHARRRRLGIEKDYFTMPAPDLRDQDVPGTLKASTSCSVATARGQFFFPARASDRRKYFPASWPYRPQSGAMMATRSYADTRPDPNSRPLGIHASRNTVWHDVLGISQ